MSELSNKKLFLFDIDGTLSVGDTLFDGSRELLEYIEKIGGSAYYITNIPRKAIGIMLKNLPNGILALRKSSLSRRDTWQSVI